MFCPNCGKENNAQGRFCTFCGNQLESIDNEKEVYTDLQNQYKDKIIEQLLDFYFKDKNIESDVIYKRAELYDMTKEQVDQIILTFQDNIKKVNIFIEKLYENKLTFDITDKEAEELVEYVGILGLDCYEYEESCIKFLDKYNENHGIYIKCNFIDSLIEQYVAGEKSLEFKPIRGIDENELKELYNQFQETLSKYEGEIKKYCNNKVDFMYDDSKADKLANIGVKFGFSKEKCTTIMFAYRDRSGVSELDRLKQMAEKQKPVLRRTKKLLQKKSCVLLGKPLTFESKYFVRKYISNYAERYIKPCAIGQDKVNKVDESSDSALYTIAEMLETFKNNSYAAIHKLENQFGLEKNSNFYNAINNYVSEKMDELLTAQEVFSEINQGVNAEAEYRRLRKANRGRWQGGGFGVGGAIKGAAEAGMMNIGSGAIHSVVNGLGNIKSEMKASRQKCKIVRSILDGIPEKTNKLLDGIDDLIIRKMELEYPDCILKKNTDVERELQKQFHDNPQSIELVISLLHENPFDVNHYLSVLRVITTIENQEDYDKNINTLVEISSWFDVDLRTEVVTTLKKDLNQMDITKETIEADFRIANSVCKDSITCLENILSNNFLQIIKKASLKDCDEAVAKIESFLQELKIESLYHTFQETIGKDVVQTLEPIIKAATENEEAQKQNIQLEETVIRQLCCEKVFLSQEMQDKIEIVVKSQLQYKADGFIKSMNIGSTKSVKETYKHIRELYIRHHKPIELEHLNSCLETYILGKLKRIKYGRDILKIKEYTLEISDVLLNSKEQIQVIEEKYNSFKVVHDYATDYIKGMDARSNLYYASSGTEYDTVEEADKIRVYVEKIVDIYENCNVHNEESLREAIAQIEDIYAQYKYGSAVIEELKCRLEQLDLLARTVQGIVYDTREEAIKESRKVVGNKKFDTEEAAEAERERLRRERELIEFEYKEISKLRVQETSNVELLRLIKIRKFQTIQGKQFEEECEKNVLNYYNSTKNSLENEINDIKSRRSKLRIAGIIATLIGFKLFFSVGLVIKVIIILIVAALWGNVDIETKNLKKCDIKNRDLQNIESIFIIQNGKMYLRGIKVKVIEKYKDKILGKLLEPGEIIEVSPDRVEQLLTARVVEKL